MSDYGWIENIVSGVVTGGATAITALIGFLRENRKKISDLETRLTNQERGYGALRESLELISSRQDLALEKFQNKTDTFKDLLQDIFGKDLSNTELTERVTRLEKNLRDLELELQDIQRSFDRLERSCRDPEEERVRQISKIKDEIQDATKTLKDIMSLLG